MDIGHSAHVPMSSPVATLDGVSLSHSESFEEMCHVDSTSLYTSIAVEPGKRGDFLLSGTCHETLNKSVPVAHALHEELLQIGSEIVGGTLDPTRSLFENGLHSLRAVELIGEVKTKYGISLSSRHMATVRSFQQLTDVVQSQLQNSNVQIRRQTLPFRQRRFLHVNYAALERIVSTWYTKLDAEAVGPRRCGRLLGAADEAIRAASYMLRRGLFRYIHIQYKDGLINFFVRPPTSVDLTAIAIVSGPRVAFAQTDYNRHFTVREIIKDSERGFYNLLHLTGLAHLEHYYRVMFFASRLEGRFDHELLEGQRYYIRSQIVKISGPLVDIDVAFYHSAAAIQAFVVNWRLMLVIDTGDKRMYDFELGAAVQSDSKAVLCEGSSFQSQDSYPHALHSRSLHMSLNSRRFLSGFKKALQSKVLQTTVPFLLLLASAVAIFTPWFLTPTCSLAGRAIATSNISPAEALVMVAIAVLWIRVSINLLDTCDGPVDGLLPHG